MTISLADLNPRNTEDRQQLVQIIKDRERRSLAAYWRNPGYDYPHPPDDVANVQQDDNEYVVLSADRIGTLAVYRVRRDGQLKRLKRWPDFRHNTRRFEVEE